MLKINSRCAQLGLPPSSVVLGSFKIFFIKAFSPSFISKLRFKFNDCTHTSQTVPPRLKEGGVWGVGEGGGEAIFYVFTCLSLHNLPNYSDSAYKSL